MNPFKIRNEQWKMQWTMRRNEGIYIAAGYVSQSKRVGVLKVLFESSSGDIDEVVKAEEVLLEQQVHVFGDVVHDVRVADRIIDQVNLPSDYQELEQLDIFMHDFIGVLDDDVGDIV